MVTHASRALIQLVNQARVALGLPRLRRLPDWETFYSVPPSRRRVPRTPFDANGAYVEDPEHPGHLPSGVYFEDSCPIARAFPVATPGDNPVWLSPQPEWFPLQGPEPEWFAERSDDESVWMLRLPSETMVRAVATAWDMPSINQFCECEDDHVHESGLAPCEEFWVRVPALIARWLDKHVERESTVSLQPLSWTHSGPVYFDPAVLTEP
jgi:hypothetical protein